MPVLGLTYAAYVSLVGASLVAFDESTSSAANHSTQPAPAHWVVGVGQTDPQAGARARRQAHQHPSLDLEWRSGQVWWRGIKPLVSAGAFADGGAHLGVGVYRDFHWGAWSVTPFTGPVLYQSQLGQSASSEILQVRTGFDVKWAISPQTQLGLGHYHLSNAQITRGSADTDVWRATLSWSL
jgi:hypothetical protein